MRSLTEDRGRKFRLGWSFVTGGVQIPFCSFPFRSDTILHPRSWRISLKELNPEMFGKYLRRSLELLDP